MTFDSNARPGATAALCLLVGLASGCGGGGSSDGAPAPPPAPPAPVNTAPVANAASLSTSEDQTLQGVLSAVDAEGNALTYNVPLSPAHGTLAVELGTGAFSYTPHPDFNGNDEFSFTVSDGRATSTSARVTIVVSPVNDAPTIQQFQAPAFGEARQLLSVTFMAFDVEGAIASMEVTQAGGGAPADFVEKPNGFEFRLPDAAEVSESTYQVRIRDADGIATEHEFGVTVWPLSASGKVTTLIGSPQSAGMHWVITGDGFLASERALLLQRASESVELVLADPALRRHRAVWNVHVVNVESAESGVDVPSIGLIRNSAFDSAFDCAGIARLICTDWSKVQAQVIPEFPAYDVLLLIVNSNRYGGSGGAVGAVISLNEAAPLIMLHEMGHSFAGLADEYPDPVVEAQNAGSYVEGTYPNITRLADLGSIPWRHWFDDPSNVPTVDGAAGIGRFEGGFYAITGFYRPSYNSFMRSLDGPVNSVHAEAWIRTIYQMVGPVLGAAPAGGSINLGPDERRNFGVMRAFPADIQEIRWSLDGEEVTSARNSPQLTCCSGLTGAHALRVDVAEVSGAIRLPGATAGRTSITWDLTIDASLKATPIVSNKVVRENFLNIQMQVDGTGHQVLGITRASRSDNKRDLADAGSAGLQYAVTSADGKTLSTGEVSDPRVLRGPLSLPGEHSTGHAVIRRDSGSYLIRVPESAAMKYLRIQPSVPAGQAAAKAQAGNAAQVIDLTRLVIR